ncbi:hypothetical protein KUM_0633 [Taylorella asinigenitalis 14/45]|uniref:Uncharacterized protein n=1 Tax=Taylorella asinigenitalis 14/45 TaxID=1091495 RepID=I7JM70_9BURK|nr:hypothetical protein [Taylorella asinigenitalis]CCG19429.1 hypothetical protein KUM_0633 [Taylorella asinigenitalis 14/45]
MDNFLIFKTAPNVDYFYDIDAEGTGELIFRLKDEDLNYHPRIILKGKFRSSENEIELNEVENMYIVEKATYKKSTFGKSLLGYITMGPIGYLLGGLDDYEEGDEVFFKVSFKDGNSLIAFGSIWDYKLAESFF